MKRETKLTPREELAAQEQQIQKQAPLEFGSVDEMLRHDALHTPVPPAIEHRLRESLGPTAPMPRPWWRRLFGR